MTSVTLIKPGSSAIASNGSNSQQPSWWTNARLVEPLWTQFTLGTSFTCTDELVGLSTLTGTMGATPGFSWDTSGNGSGTNGLVGLALKLSAFTGAENISTNAAAYATATASGLVVIKPSAGGSMGVVAVHSDNVTQYLSVNIDSSGIVHLFSGNIGSNVWSSAGAVPVGEWHVLGWSLDASNLTAVKFNIAIDGSPDAHNTDTAATFSLAAFNITNYRMWYGNAGSGQWSSHDIAFLVDWSDAKSTAFLEAITAASNTASVGPYQMISMGGVAPVPSYRPNRLVYRRVSS